MQSLEIVARFALKPNQLGICGDKSQELLKRSIVTGDYHEVQERISTFRDLSSFLYTIGNMAGINPFSPEAVKAYWLGNSFLEKATLVDYEYLLEQYQKNGLPEEILKELHARKPARFIPTHAFQVLHIGFPGIADWSDSTKALNLCLIRSGRVMEVDTSARRATVSIISLDKNSQGYVLTGESKETVSFDPQLVPGLHREQIVAVHWGNAASLLTEDEKKALDYWTEKVISVS